MTYEDKVNYLRIALQLQNIGIDNKMADRILQTYDKLMEVKGKFSVSDAVEIDIAIERKYTKKKLEEQS